MSQHTVRSRDPFGILPDWLMNRAQAALADLLSMVNRLYEEGYTSGSTALRERESEFFQIKLQFDGNITCLDMNGNCTFHYDRRLIGKNLGKYKDISGRYVFQKLSITRKGVRKWIDDFDPEAFNRESFGSYIQAGKGKPVRANYAVYTFFKPWKWFLIVETHIKLPPNYDPSIANNDLQTPLAIELLNELMTKIERLDDVADDVNAIRYRILPNLAADVIETIDLLEANAASLSELAEISERILASPPLIGEFDNKSMGKLQSVREQVKSLAEAIKTTDKIPHDNKQNLISKLDEIANFSSTARIVANVPLIPGILTLEQDFAVDLNLLVIIKDLFGTFK